jgi:hypothetical protein
MARQKPFAFLVCRFSWPPCSRFSAPNIYVGAAVVQIVFNLTAITALYALTLKLTNRPKTALIAVFLATFALGDIVYANALLSDSLAQSHMVFMLYFYARFILGVERRFDGMALVAGSLALLAMIFLRPIFLYLPFAILAGVAVFLWTAKQPRRILPALGIIAFFVLLPTTLWTLRNETLGGVRQFSSVSSQFLLDSVPILYAKTHGIHFYEAQPIVSGGHDEDLQPYLATMQKPDAYKKRAIEMIKSDPMTYASAYLARIPCLFFYPEINDALRFIPAISTRIAEFKAAFVARSFAPISDIRLSAAYLAAACLNTLALVVVLGFAVRDLFLQGANSWVKRLALGVLCYVAVLSCFPVGYGSYPRFRLGVSMPLILFAALGAAHFQARIAARRQR